MSILLDIEGDRDENLQSVHRVQRGKRGEYGKHRPTSRSLPNPGGVENPFTYVSSNGDGDSNVRVDLPIEEERVG